MRLHSTRIGDRVRLDGQLDQSRTGLIHLRDSDLSATTFRSIRRNQSENERLRPERSGKTAEKSGFERRATSPEIVAKLWLFFAYTGLQMLTGC